MDNATTPTSVYLYFDEFDVLLYVGITGRGSQRQREHNRDKDWWRFVDHQTVEHFGSRVEALAREAELIASRRPPFNAQHNMSHDRDRASYLAFRACVTTDPMALLRQSGQRVPLGVLSRNHDLVEVVTPVEFAPVAMSLVLAGQAKCLVGTVRCGHVVDFLRRGAHGLLTLKVRADAEIADPFVRVRVINTKQGPQFDIKNIQLALGEVVT